MTLFVRRQLSAVLALLSVGCTSPEVVAKVGSRKLTQADVKAVVSSRSKAAPMKAADALDSLIDRELLAEGARRAGMAEDAAILARLHTMEREVLAQAYLERESKALDEGALKKRYDETREALKTREVHVAQIFISLPAGASDGARQQAQSKTSAAYARLMGGDDFAAVANEVSDDKPSGARGGDLGAVREGQVNQDFFAAALALKSGELSKPFRTEYGLHIIKALEAPGEVTPSFDEVRGRLLADARHDLEVALRKRLEAEVTVKRYPDHLPTTGGAE